MKPIAKLALLSGGFSVGWAKAEMATLRGREGHLGKGSLKVAIPTFAHPSEKPPLKYCFNIIYLWLKNVRASV